MKRQPSVIIVLIAALLVATYALPANSVHAARALSAGPVASAHADQVEPHAGTWQTWVLTSGSQLRLPPPPNKHDTKAELRELRALAAQRDATALDQIAFWNAGPPGYR